MWSAYSLKLCDILCQYQSRSVSIYWSRIPNLGILPVRSIRGTRLYKTSAIKKTEHDGKCGRNMLGKRPDLSDFLVKSANTDHDERENEEIIPPYLANSTNCAGKLVYFETYGCQMNVNDAEYAWAILQNKGYSRTRCLEKADVILLVTCSIREKAEERIWSRLRKLKTLKEKSVQYGYPKVALLGCMAERLKEQVLEKEKAVDVIAGPDSYRHLPRLLQESSENYTTSINVMLSVDETYADIMPVRLDEGSKTAFVSIMRGCDNMCSFCIVPFTRGRERSRPISSIVEEVKQLSSQGIRQVTLLGQNVNSYIDNSVQHSAFLQPTASSKGFKTIYKPKVGGLRFADLLAKVSLVDPDMRIRFTSPHPKDFPDEVLNVINERSNICKQVHLPVQSGSSQVLRRMRRGYTRDDYLDLAHRIRKLVPGVSLSTDMISGFCGETEADHEATLSLMKEVKYENAFMFAYSMRKKTHAYHQMHDDVPIHIKKRRLQEVIGCFRNTLKGVLQKAVGEVQHVLIESVDTKPGQESATGRNEGNIKVTIPIQQLSQSNLSGINEAECHIGSYVATKIVSAGDASLVGEYVSHILPKDFCNIQFDS